MGHTATLIGAVALATGLICLLCGYFWGRSNLRSQVEDAVDLVRRSADAREFDLREQLEQKMLELSDFRPRIEGQPRSQKQLAQNELQQVNASAANGSEKNESGNTRKRPAPKQEAAPPLVDPTETTIQNLLKSMEEKLKQPEELPQVVAQASLSPAPPKPAPPSLPANKPDPVTQQNPRPAASESSPAAPRLPTQRSAPPPPAKLPQQQPRVATQAATRPSPAKPPASNKPPAAKDEWQEFAASLEALRQKSK